MRGVLILNGCSGSYPDQALALAAFAAEKAGGVEFTASLVIHDDQAEPSRLAEAVTTDRAILINIGTYHPQTVLEVLPEFCDGFDLLLFPGNIFGEELAARLAFRLQGTALIGATVINCDQERLLVDKQVYSHHLEARFEMTGRPVCLAIGRGSGSNRTKPVRPESVKTERYDRRAAGPAHVLKSELWPEEGEKGLSEAPLLIAAGQGIGQAATVRRLEELARLLKARLGVSRPVAMNAWAPLNQLIGVSGAMTSPELCLTFGVSGAPAFYAGIEKSRVIISVNKDPKAPIIGKSDVAVVDDCGPVIEELIKLLTR